MSTEEGINCSCDKKAPPNLQGNSGASDRKYQKAD